MRIVTVLGTRPEIIRLSRIIPELDRYAEHVLVHTGQNHTATLSDIFFEQMGIRPPDRSFGVDEPGFAPQIGRIMTECANLFAEIRPDRLLILGDTNSAFASVVAARMGIPVFHMEAGNRCFDSRVPEEVNRRIIDHSSDVLMPYTERSRQNLLREGFRSDRIYVTGNPIYEVINHHGEAVAASSALASLGVSRGQYFLATLHRAENVDLPERLQELIHALDTLAQQYGIPVIMSTHPRTRSRLNDGSMTHSGEDLQFIEPVGFFDFLALEKNARCVLTDSGTVQEECAIFGVPAVTLRDVTERPETVECGANILTGSGLEHILSAVRVVLAKEPGWKAPPEYLAPAVSGTVVRIVTGYHHGISGVQG